MKRSMLWSSSKPKLIAHIAPLSRQTEDFRDLRTNIQFALGQADRKVLMITSAYANEGKSTVAANLAIVYGQLGKRVLLIDADLRHSSLHRLFSASNLIGLTHVLSGECQAEDAWLELPIPNVLLLTGGSPTALPTELLASRQMDRLIELARKTFDIVIIDASPALEISDAQMLAGSCDGVILVVNKGKVRREIAAQTIDKLEFAGAKVVGIVLNSKRGKPRRMSAT